ncbi:Cof-type HAD-IIB family hydrolase [Actinomyces oricola]|uniref:Cof-type HAD-IIB family hydrolase n=1 Tax=Actinomyces oricola TaxID=206043 RepID=UPI000FFF527F|nr:Cof-type HAD-IIB family hydrolase [Actinomyces oricola]
MRHGPRMIFLDVDGTLVDYENRLPRSAAQAVGRARAAGHRVYACTGRSKAEMPAHIWAIGLDGMIGGNGAYVEDDGTVLLHQHLSGAQCAQIVSWLTRRGLVFYLEANSGLYAPPAFAHQALAALRAYAAGKGTTDTDTLDVSDIFPEMILTKELVRDDVNKISFVLSSYADLEAAREQFSDLLVGSWGGRGHDALFGDVARDEANKVQAIDLLLEHRGIDLQDSIAFGDATVDIGMLQHCGVGVAMGNGSEQVKAAADLVTDDVEDDGLLKAFERLGLMSGPPAPVS